MFFEFKDKVTLISGSAGGIGSIVAEKYSGYGANVYRTDIIASEGEDYIQGDISDPEFIKSLVKKIMDREGRIDILINNAGICPRTSFSEISVEEWKKVMDINLTSVFLLSQAVMEIMIRQKSGSIVNLTSTAGKVGGIAVGAHYSASKAAIGCLTKTLAKTGAAHGVRVNAVAPGIIDTKMQDELTESQLESFLNTIPMGRMGTTAEVANMIMVLSSDLSSYITGINLDINGGLLM
jgi:3-oxoacyl-[acyl-carrier protein] reductase